MRYFMLAPMLALLFVLTLAPPLHAQNFSPPRVWTSEDFTNEPPIGGMFTPTALFDWFTYDGGSPRRIALGSNYEKAKFVLTGNFNGDPSNIPEIALLFDISGKLGVYTVESRGFRMMKPETPYHNADTVNRQEGTLLFNYWGDADTYHPTIIRFDENQASIWINSVKFAVAGDFDGNGADDIALFVVDSSVSIPTQKIVLLTANRTGDTLNYEMQPSVAYTFPAGFEFGNIRFVTAGKYSTTLAASQIAILYDDPSGNEQIITLDPGSPWTMSTHYNKPKSKLNFNVVKFVASGQFVSNSCRVALCCESGVDQMILITNPGLGSSWTLTTKFNQTGTLLDYDYVRGVVAGQFDNDATTDELAFFCDYGNDNTGLGSVQKILVTDHGSPSWSYTEAINEKRSGMDFDRILHYFAANLDYNDGTRRDEIGVLYNDQRDQSDGQERQDDKIIVWTNLPPVSENPMIFKTGGNPFFMLGWAMIPMGDIPAYAHRAGGHYNTLWMTNLWRDWWDWRHMFSGPPDYESAYELSAENNGLKCLPRADLDYNFSGDYIDRLHSHYDPPIIGWELADEPDIHSDVVTPTTLGLLNSDIDANDSYVPKRAHIPIMYDDHGTEYFHNQFEVAAVDGYPFQDDPETLSRPAMFPGYMVHKTLRSMDAMIRYDKKALIYVAQGTRGVRGRMPNFEEVRQNTFGPVIAGARGVLYYADTTTSDTIRKTVDMVVDELGHYTRAFMTPSLMGRVSTNKNRYVQFDFDPARHASGFDWWGFKMRYMPLIMYDLHQDTDGIYYLFVVNNWSQPVTNVELTTFGTSGAVSMLHPEYFKNGHYTPIAARTDVSGGYQTFTDSFEPYEVKIYAIGARPAVDASVQSFTGSLSNSNQRKMIASGTAHDDAGSILYSDTIYYHLTYDRYDPVSHRNKVYYRRSKPTRRDIPAESAEWESWEIALSDRIDPYWSMHDTLQTCAYPSLVVRYDTNAHQNKAYVVFACDGGAVAPGGYIVESVLKADSIYATPTPQPPLARILGSYVGRTMSDWGTPMINASADMNYYVWADSLSGIMAGWKRPQDASLQASISFHRLSTGFDAKHPSVNTYSRIREGENDCSVVWQEGERSDPLKQSQVYYTQLWLNGLGHLTKLLPPTNGAPAISFPLSPDGTMGLVSTPGQYGVNTMPTVFRSVEEGISLLYGGRQREGHDQIYWEASATPGLFTVTRQLGWRGIHLYEYPGSPSVYTMYPSSPRYIWSQKADLMQPSAAQGSFRSGALSTYHSAEVVDSAAVLAFTKMPRVIGGLASIWHFPHSYRRWDQPQISSDMNDLTGIKQIEGAASNPQLAAQPFVNSKSDWYHNHRAFISGSTGNITASRRYYSKLTEIGDLAACPLVGFAGDSLFCMLSPFRIGARFLTFAAAVDSSDTTFVLSGDTMTMHRFPTGDTIRSPWFPLGDTETIGFAVLGRNTHGGSLIMGSTERTQVWVECRRTGVRRQLILPQGNDSIAVPVEFTLLNGGDEDYRILIVNRSSNVSYTEQIVLDGLPMSDSTLFGGTIPKRDVEGSTIDLAPLHGPVVAGYQTLLVYPNPTSDKISVTMPLPGSAERGAGAHLSVRIISTIGEMMSKIPAQAGQTIEIPVDGWPSGSYLIRVVDGATVIAQQRIVVSR